MPPKRMSDILASSSTDTRINSTPIPTTAPPSSEDPTLPIAGASTSEHATNVSPNGKKRKRTTTEGALAPNKTAVTDAKINTTQSLTRTNHPSLYEPWTLLPAKEKKAVEARGTHKITPLVFSKNQNVKAGITKIRRYISAETSGTEAIPAALKDEDAVIAVSAQGDGTVKLVGIIDMVKRITREAVQEKKGGVKWYTYTVLSSVTVPRKSPAAANGSANASNAADQRDEDRAEDGEAMDVDGHEGVKETQEPSKDEGVTKTVPVLTAWMTRRWIPGFKEAFGEHEVVVHENASRE
ncbi:hypothetical protein SLS59_005801 [Nothophoma quercina]|uniref:DNA/RNA-binding protein Alba-like domain-containing protein n=1 Tax=Nothophoma quercina TaxID=749835 RepID=A0ABR3R7K0_9PLEO